MQGCGFVCVVWFWGVWAHLQFEARFFLSRCPFFLLEEVFRGLQIWGMKDHTRTSASEHGLELQFGGDMPKLKSGSFLGFWGY